MIRPAPKIRPSTVCLASLRPVAAFCLILLMVSGLAACDISTPSLPGFDSRVDIPLGSERLTIAEAIDGDPSLVTDDDGGLSFSTGGEPDTVSLGMDLDTDISAQHIHQAIGSFSVTAPDPVLVREDFEQAWPEASQLVGTTATVPAFDFTLAAEGLELGGIQSCTFTAGTMTLTAVSTWPVEIRGLNPGDPVDVRLLDETTGEILLTIPVGPIPPDGESATTTSLAGLTLPGGFKLVLDGRVDGSPDPVAITGDESLVLTLSFTDLTAASATAIVPPQTIDLSFVTDLGGDNDITTAEVGSGSLSFTLHNEMPLPVAVDLSWNEVITSDGLPLTASADLTAGGDATITVPFGGCRISAEGDPLTSLTAQVSARTPGSGNQPITLSSTQGLTADLAPGVLSFTMVSGCFEPASWDLEPTTEQIVYPDDSEGMTFTSATLTIRLDNTADLGADLALTITGTPSHGDPVSLLVNDYIEPAAGGSAKTTVLLDEHNSDLLAFLNARPRSITLAGTISVAPGSDCGTVRADDRLAVDWELDVPLIVTLEDAVLSGDPRPLGLDADLQDTIEHHAGAARFQAEIGNHIPAAMELTLLAAEDPADLPDHPGLEIGPILVASAQVDPQNGEAAGETVSRPVIELTQEQSRYLGRPGVATMYRAVLSSTGDVPVRLKSTDYLTVSGLVTMDLRVGEED